MPEKCDGVANFWRAVGGRKTFNGYLAYITLTVMAFALGATFVEYAGGMLLALGITSGFVAMEDRDRRNDSYNSLEEADAHLRK